MTPTPRLIIIDDDPLLAEIVVHIARDAFPREEDLAIECALTAEAGLVAIQRVAAKTDLTLIVISDFNLSPSEITGLDVLAEVKRRLPRAARVLTTGRDPDELAHLVDAARLDAFVPKPFTFDQMRALIVALVEERAPQRGTGSATDVPMPASSREATRGRWEDHGPAEMASQGFAAVHVQDEGADAAPGIEASRGR